MAALAVAVLTVGGCTNTSDGGGPDATAAKTQITILTQATGTNPDFVQALIKKFEVQNPDIEVTMRTQPSGTDGDALVKSKLTAGKMADVFTYKSGALFESIDPDRYLVPLGNEAWAGTLSADYKEAVGTEKGVYGAPLGTLQAGGVLYNKKVYADLGLTVPTNWAQFAANNERIRAAGAVDPIEQTYADSWTSELFVLADFGNVSAQDPNWATQFTANKRRYVDQPAVQGFLNLQDAAQQRWFNEGYGSASYEDGIKAVATGTAAHYPMLTGSISVLNQSFKDQVNDVGIFPLPAQNARDTRLTVWLPNAAYIPKTTTGAKLDAAKKFVAFINSPDGCTIQGELTTITGPFVTSNCTIPAGAAPMVGDVRAYVDAGKASPALEFFSPISGPNLDKIAVDVGSRTDTGRVGAELYDQDVKKEAERLGVDGW